jgi:hypothetical protein
MITNNNKIKVMDIENYEESILELKERLMMVKQLMFQLKQKKIITIF